MLDFRTLRVRFFAPRQLWQFQVPISVFSNPLADSGLGRTPSGLVQNPIWASPNPPCKGFEFRGEHGEGFDFFGAGGTRRRRVRILARGFRFSREGFEYLRGSDEGFEFFRGIRALTRPKNQKKIRGNKNVIFMYTFTLKNAIFRRRRPGATLRVPIGFGQAR